MRMRMGSFWHCWRGGSEVLVVASCMMVLGYLEGIDAAELICCGVVDNVSVLGGGESPHFRSLFRGIARILFVVRDDNFWKSICWAI